MRNDAEQLGIDLDKLYTECPIHPTQTEIESAHARKAKAYWEVNQWQESLLNTQK